MRIVKLQGRISLTIDGGVVSGDNNEAVRAADVILEGEYGRFNNDEVYPDMDGAIADFLAERLGGEVIDDE
jgi:hypothetical protein